MTLLVKVMFSHQKEKEKDNSIAKKKGITLSGQK